MAQKSFADDILQVLDAFAKRIERFASEFLEAVLHFLRDAATWLERVSERIAQYLRRLFPVLGHVGVALIKLFLIYLPGLLVGIVSISSGSVAWTVAALIYMGFMTLIGTSYRN